MGKSSLRAHEGSGRTLTGRLFDAGLRVLPMEIEERCANPVCRRVTFMYGPLYEHDQLNLATHDALHEIFGLVSLSAFDHMAAMVRRRHAVAADGTTYLRNLERLAIPITFLHGGDNACFLPAGSRATMEALVAANGPGLYRHTLIPDYGDLDCIIGKNAARDVFPLVLGHLSAAR
jgi:cholesterol oxidase